MKRFIQRLKERKDAKRKKKQWKELAKRRLPTKCEGYPYPMTPTNVTEECSFYIPRGDDDTQQLLACSLYYHKGTTGSKKDAYVVKSLDTSIPVIIICHGYASWRNQMLLSHLAGGLHKRGSYHALRFDFRGNGQSTGECRYSNYQGEYEDLQAVVRFVREDLRCQIACIVGHSKASTTVLRTAVKHPDAIPCYVNLSGRFSVPGTWNIAERFGEDQARALEANGSLVVSRFGTRDCMLTMQDVKERNALDSSTADSIKANVLTIHGSDDETVSVTNAHAFDRTIPRHELLIVEGADHNFNGLRHMTTLVEAVAGFVDEHRG